MLTVALGATLAVAAVVALVTAGALSSAGDSSLLEVSQGPGSSMGAPSRASTDSRPISRPMSSVVEEPHSENWTQFLPKAKAVLQSLGFTVEDVAKKTDLDEGCGTMLIPCVATVGSCITSNLVRTSDKHIAANSDACQCFPRGLAEPINVPQQPEVQVSCTYQCLESIRSAFEVRSVILFLNLVPHQFCNDDSIPIALSTRIIHSSKARTCMFVSCVSTPSFSRLQYASCSIRKATFHRRTFT
jgi:hypothetical protein